MEICRHLCPLWEELLVLLFAEKTPKAQFPEELLVLLLLEKTRCGTCFFFFFFTFWEKSKNSQEIPRKYRKCGREELLVLLFAEKTPNAQFPEELLCLLLLEKTRKMGKNNYYVFFFREKYKRAQVQLNFSIDPPALYVKTFI